MYASINPSKEQLKAIKELAHRETVLLAATQVKDMNKDQLRATFAETMVQTRFIISKIHENPSFI